MHVPLPLAELYPRIGLTHDRHPETAITTAHNPGEWGANRGQGPARHLHHQAGVCVYVWAHACLDGWMGGC